MSIFSKNYITMRPMHRPVY